MNQLCPITDKVLYKILMPQISQRFYHERKITLKKLIDYTLLWTV